MTDPAPPAGTWLARGDTIIYDCAWLRLVTTDVTMPDGTRLEHHVVRLPRPAAGTIITRDGHVLLLHRHRFITDTWGWEIPAGAVDEGESVEAAAVRESAEESGWRPRTVTPLCTFNPANGVLDQVFHIFVSDDAVDTGGPTDLNEAASIGWYSFAEVRAMLLDGRINDGLSFGGLLHAALAGVI